MTKIDHSPATIKRKRRVRGKVQGTTQRPRVTIYRSNKNIYVQVIDDSKAVTVASANDLSTKKSSKSFKGTKIEKAVLVAKEVAQQLKTKKVTSLAFDRGHYKYHGRVKAVAQTLREAGLDL